MQIQSQIEPRELLRQWRIGISVSQAQMAALMGVPLRTYEDLEGGKSTVRPVHINAAAWALTEYAAGNGGSGKLPVDIGEVVKAAAKD